MEYLGKWNGKRVVKVKKKVAEEVEVDEWNPDTSIVDKFFEELEKIDR